MIQYLPVSSEKGFITTPNFRLFELQFPWNLSLSSLVSFIYPIMCDIKTTYSQ